MKPKNRKRLAPRNPFVAAAKFKRAGSHAKANKALRRQEKVNQGRLAHLAELPAFNRVRISGRPPLKVNSKAHGFGMRFAI